MENEYKTVCDYCGGKTWYTTEQPCRRTITPACTKCGGREHSDPVPCPGTLRIIDRSDLAPQFAPYHKNGQRIIVKTHHGETLRGYVGITTGWKPVYILLKNSNSSGSSEILRADDEIAGTVNKHR